MNSSSPLNIVITDEDIDEIEKILKPVKFDEQRRKIIKNISNLDVQALPGTGKTTLLVAKLAILAKKWPFHNRGLCILSHTNVARKEIEAKLGKTGIGEKLLSYPHFIGTFHSFFDKFAALPFLRSHEKTLRFIDTEKVLQKRYLSLKKETQFYLNKSRKTNAVCESLTYPPLDCNGEKSLSKSDKDIRDTIRASMDEGFYTFNELLQVSKYALTEWKFLAQAISFRFPVIFIDEFQDTSELQEELIGELSCDPELVIQTFGDQNQTIFGSHCPVLSEFKRPTETVVSSLRFGNNVAKLADPLGRYGKGLQGTYKYFEHLADKNTIFLFNDPKNVLPAYGECLLDCFSDQELNSGLDCYAIGMVHKKTAEESEKPKIPHDVSDYYPPYNPTIEKEAKKSEKLIDFYLEGKALFDKSKDHFRFLEKLCEAFRLYLSPPLGPSFSPGEGALKSLLKMVPESKHTELKQDLLALKPLNSTSSKEWEGFCNTIKNLLKRYFETVEFSDSFFDIQADRVDPPSTLAACSPTPNVYSYSKSNRTVDIHLSSIHATKGETHLATLVLDTHFYTYNVKDLLPWLLGNPTKKGLNKTRSERLGCHYVGLTRARALICLATRKDSITGIERNKLRDLGWRVLEVD